MPLADVGDRRQDFKVVFGMGEVDDSWGTEEASTADFAAGVAELRARHSKIKEKWIKPLVLFLSGNLSGQLFSLIGPLAATSKRSPCPALTSTSVLYVLL